MDHRPILNITGTICAIQESTTKQPDKPVPTGAIYCPLQYICTSKNYFQLSEAFFVPSGAKYFIAEKSFASEDNSRSPGALLVPTGAKYLPEDLRASGAVATVIERSRIKRIEMKPNVKRLKSFNCQHNHVKDTKDLALAGFYCTGQGDCVRCFYCGGGLRHWLQEDDVWVEHAKWFPKCGYLLEQMGQIFIDTVQELKSTQEQISLQEVETLISARRQRTMCNDCYQREIEVTYYPCGHMTCYHCAHNERNRPCHVCRRDVMRRIQTWLPN